MNRLICFVLIITALLSCGRVDENKVDLKIKKKSSLVQPISTREFQRQKKRINSKSFLEKHGLSVLNEDVKLLDDDCYPKEVIGTYIVFRAIIKNKVVEYKLKTLLVFFTKTSLGVAGSGSNILNIQLNRFKYATALSCICDNESFVLWLFADNKMVLAGDSEKNDSFIFLVKH